MAITEDQRHDLYEGLIEVLGRAKATTLMEHLPPVGWADVATKRDLDHQSAVSRRDLEVESGKLRQEIRSEFAAVRNEMSTEFAAVRNEISSEFAAVRNEFSGEFADVRQEVAAVEVRFERALRDTSRAFFLGMLAANTALAGLAFAAAQFA